MSLLTQLKVILLIRTFSLGFIVRVNTAGCHQREKEELCVCLCVWVHVCVGVHAMLLYMLCREYQGLTRKVRTFCMVLTNLRICLRVKTCFKGLGLS